MPTLSEAVDMYMLSDEVAGLTLSTRKRTRIALNALVATAGPRTIASRINRGHIDQTIAGWRAKGRTEATTNNYKTTLRGFGAWMFDTRLNRSDVAKHLKSVKVTIDYAKRKPLTREQVSKILKHARFFHERDYVTVMILLSTGLRGGEVCGLRWRDVDLDAAEVRAYRGKNRDVHVVPMSTQLHDVLSSWRVEYARRVGDLQEAFYVVPALRSPDGLLAPNASHTLPLAPSRPQTNLAQRLKKFMKSSGVDDLVGKGTHTARRTAAQALLDSGATVRDVQTMLGHASEEMTQNYLSIDSAREDLRARVKDWTI